MEHRKMYHTKSLHRPEASIQVEGPVSGGQLQAWCLHAQLSGFRPPAEQREALREIASLPEGRVIVARVLETVVGYITFHYPDQGVAWAEGRMSDLIEFGAIEVAPDYRRRGLGKAMLELAFAGGQMDDVIVFATEYADYWDLDGTGLSAWEYRRMTERLMQGVGLVWYATDDPDIGAHPANCLLARIGGKVPVASMERFDRLRFRRLGEY